MGGRGPTMKNENSRYLFASGIATGVIMSLVSVLTIFQLIKYLEAGGNFATVVVVSMIAALLMGAIISFIVSLIVK